MRTFFLFVALLLIVPSAAFAQGGGLNRIHFARGRTSATISGRMTARDVASDYVVDAQKNQRLTVRLESSEPRATLTFIGPNIYLPEADEVRQWTGRLPKSGEYVFRVASSRSASFAYRLQIEISAASLAPADSALTGTYEAGDFGTLDVQALPGGRVHFYLLALGVLHAPGGPNTGEVEATLPLHQGVGVYTTPDKKGRLILRFTPSRVYISQIGASWDMGFGMGVAAGGIYKKTSSQRPKFDTRGF